MSIQDDQRIAEEKGWRDFQIRRTPQLFFPGQFDESLWAIPPGKTEPERVPFFSMQEPTQ